MLGASTVDTEALTGETWYIAKAVSNGGEGVETRADAWIGEDGPLAVTDLQSQCFSSPPLLLGQHPQAVCTADM